MAKITLELPDVEYLRLQKQAQHAGKKITVLILDWIAQLAEMEEYPDMEKDPLYQFEGFDSDAPADLSINADKYLYGEKA